MLGFVFGLYGLVVGLATVFTAASFARRPQERTLAILRPLSASTAFTAVSAMLAGSATALKYAAEGAPATQLMAGLAEAAVAGVLAFAFLAVAWLLAAVGFRRQT